MKGEVNGCDVVAIRDRGPVIVELQPGYSLPLVFQGIARQGLSDKRCCMDRGGDGIRPFPSGSVRRCVRTQAVRVRLLCSELSGRP